MFQTKDENLNHNKENLPELASFDNRSKSSPKPEHKRKKRKKRGTINSKTENDNDILVQNDALVHRTSSVPSTASGSETNFVTHESAETNGLIKQDVKKSDFSEDVRKVALTLAVTKMTKPEVQENLVTLDHVDYVLVYSDEDKHNQLSKQVLNKLRNDFEKKVELEGVSIVRKKKGNLTFVAMSCCFERLCKEAEAVCLKMPLAGVGLP